MEFHSFFPGITFQQERDVFAIAGCGLNTKYTQTEMPLSFLDSVADDADESPRSVLMERFASENPIVSLISWINELTDVHSYSQLVELGDAGTRSLNSSRRGSPSKTITKYVPYKLISDISQTDWQIAAQNPLRAADEQLNKMRSFSDLWTWMFFHGSTDLDPEQFDGLRAHAQKHPRQLIHNHESGAPLSRMMLRKAITNTKGANAILMSEEILDWFSEGTQTQNRPNIVWRTNEIGIDIPMFRNVPIIRIQRDELDRQLLPSTEGSKDLSSNNCTSVYVVSMRDGGLQGINFSGPQGYGINVKELGQVDVFEQTLLDWKTAIVAKDVRSITRLAGVKAAPPTD
jgi:hypothetical protein